MGGSENSGPDPDEPTRGGSEMLRDQPSPAEAATSEEGTDGSGSERRRAYRRPMPFGRGAVLLIGDRAHIVGLADLSVTGAYLRMRLALRVGDVHTLKLLIPPERAELRLQARVVRVSLEQDESHHHTRGVAVHFLEVSRDDRRRLEAFVGNRR